MFIGAEFAIAARKWHQLRCSSTDEWTMKIRYTFRVEYQSAMKKNAVKKFVGE